MKKYLHCLFMALAAMLLLSALPGCDQSGDDGADPPPASGVYESVEDLANLAGIETGGPYTVILGSGIDISQSWGEVNDAIYAAKKFVILDLSACNAESIEGNLATSPSYATNPSGNDFNIIRYNPYITGLILPNSLKYLDSGALMGCLNLGSVILPEGLLYIGPAAFYGCTSLTTLTLPDSVTDIATYAFRGCTSLTSVNIPAGVASLPGTFYGCTSLTSVAIHAGVTELSETFRGCTGLTSVTIPSGVGSLASTFYGCTGLISVTIPSGVTALFSAFTSCSNLTTVVFEGDSTGFMSSSFPGNSSLQTAYQSGGAGTYTRSSGGTTWSKSP